MKKIRLGRTNLQVTRIGFGGIPIQNVSESNAIAVVRKCLELGINYLDTANAYTNSQERIGKAIAGLREKPFLATKSFARTSDGLKNDLKQSLKMLGVESIDLYQFHNVTDSEDYKQILGPGGAMEALLEAKRNGQVKHIGITTHQVDMAKKAIESGQFETVMYPFNFITNEAAEELLPLAKKHDVGFIAIKSLGGGRIQNVHVALKYLFQFPDILVLPGIAKITEIEEIVSLLDKPKMTRSEVADMKQLREMMSPRFCRHCDYCKPCPQGINISTLMDYEMMVKDSAPEKFYTGHLDEVFSKAANCDNCGECDNKCPYDMPVTEIVNDYVRQYTEGKKKFLAGRA